MLKPHDGEPDHVVTFGFFDGTLDELNASQDTGGYEAMRDAVAPYVSETVVNGIYDVVVHLEPHATTT